MNNSNDDKKNNSEETLNNDGSFRPIDRNLFQKAIKQFDPAEGMEAIDSPKKNIPTNFNHLDNEDNWILYNYRLAEEREKYLDLTEDEKEQKIYVGETLEVIRRDCLHNADNAKTGLKDFKEYYMNMRLTSKQVSLYRKSNYLYSIVGHGYFDYINNNLSEKALCIFTKAGLNEYFISTTFEEYATGKIKSIREIEELIYTSPDSFYDRKEQLDSLLTMVKRGFSKRNELKQIQLIEDLYKVFRNKK